MKLDQVNQPRAAPLTKLATPDDYTAAGVQWTVVRGVAFDLTDFLAGGAHPGGSYLARLAVGRDATALLETNHLRVDKPYHALKGLPVLEGFPVDKVDQSPRPSDSHIYRRIRQRVVDEVFDGAPRRGAGKGGEWQAATAIALFAAGATLWLASPGCASGLVLGLAAAFVALTLFHAGNHGAMSSKPAVNLALALTGDVIGASSLAWRYKHQVSHHIWTGDHEKDSDLLTPFPRLRFDSRLPLLSRHNWQAVYMYPLFCFMYVTFFTGDVRALLFASTKNVVMKGAVASERASALGLRLAHHWLLLGQPLLNAWLGAGNGPSVLSVLTGAMTYAAVLSFLLAVIFAVSHNTVESKQLLPAKPAGGAARGAGASAHAGEHGEQGDASEDWGKAQIYHSANWGGTWANYLTGGLSLQIEHHLFPAIYPGHYPAISKIVAQECSAHGVQYKQYTSFWAINSRFLQAVRDLSSA